MLSVDCVEKGIFFVPQIEVGRVLLLENTSLCDPDRLYVRLLKNCKIYKILPTVLFFLLVWMDLLCYHSVSCEWEQLGYQ